MADDLNLHQLKAFYYAAQCRSITLAADRLFITQPAVSMQIKALEEQYGIKLFIRRKKMLELTDAGRNLYQLAKKIFALVDEAEQVLARSKEVLKVGSSKTLVRYRLAGYISRFQSSYPCIQIQIHEGSSEAMVQSVLKGEIDIAIAGRCQFDDERLEVIPFTRDEVVLVASPSHPLSSRQTVSIADLSGESLILRETGSGTRRVIEKALEQTSIVPSSFIESGNVDFIKELVRIGDGITMLARMGVDPDVSRGQLKIIPLEEGPFFLDIDIVLSKERTLSAAEQAFLRMLMEAKADADASSGRAQPASKKMSGRDRARSRAGSMPATTV